MPNVRSIKIVGFVEEGSEASLRYDVDNARLVIGVSGGGFVEIPTTGKDLTLGNGQKVLSFLTAVTANSTATTAPVGSVAVTSHATGRGKIFISDGAKWQLAIISTGAAAAQFARPTSDISNAGLWVQSAGASLFATLDETVASDTDHIDSPVSPVNAICEVKLSAVTDPVSSSGHIIRYRYARTSEMHGGGATADIEDLVVKLVQGTTVLKTWTHTGVSSKTTATQTLSSGEADSITDYSDLRLRFQANETAADSGSGVAISWCEMEVPAV